MKKVIILLLVCVHTSIILYHNLSSMAGFDKKDKTNLCLIDNALPVIKSCKTINQQLKPIFGNKVFNAYHYYTGITGYVFFSPNPPDPKNLYFVSNIGDRRLVTELGMNTTEGKLRSKCMSGELLMAESEIGEKLVTAKVRSISARFFELNPRLKEAKLCVVQRVIPTITDFNAGKKVINNAVLTYKIQTK